MSSTSLCQVCSQWEPALVSAPPEICAICHEGGDQGLWVTGFNCTHPLHALCCRRLAEARLGDDAPFLCPLCRAEGVFAKVLSPCDLRRQLVDCLVARRARSVRSMAQTLGRDILSTMHMASPFACCDTDRCIFYSLPAWVALEHNTPEVLEALLETGMSPDALHECPEAAPRALTVALQRGDAAAEIVHTLLQRGASPLQQPGDDLPPLVLATSVGAFECALLLLAAGAPACATSLMHSVRLQQEGNVASLLLEAGAVPSTLALVTAISAGNQPVAQAMAERLLQQGSLRSSVSLTHLARSAGMTELSDWMELALPQSPPRLVRARGAPPPPRWLITSSDPRNTDI